MRVKPRRRMEIFFAFNRTGWETDPLDSSICLRNCVLEECCQSPFAVFLRKAAIVDQHFFVGIHVDNRLRPLQARGVAVDDFMFLELSRNRNCLSCRGLRRMPIGFARRSFVRSL